MRVWDVQSSQQIGRTFQDDWGVSCVGFDDKISIIATGSFNGTEKLWDVESGSCILTSADPQWSFQLNQLSLSWKGLFNKVLRRKNIIDIDEKENKQF